MRSFFIHDAYLNVAILFKHKEIEMEVGNETLVLNQDRFTPVATDIWFPTFLRSVTDGYLMRPSSQEQVERAATKPTAPPRKFYWYGGNFIFDVFSNTDKLMKIWYKRKPVEFTGTGSSELDEMFDPLIIMDAARVGFETVRDFDQAKQQVQLFSQYVTEKKLPVDQAKLNDYQQGFRVRTR
jgi:hypothetical protein